jgi:hypothetical protein
MLTWLDPQFLLNYLVQFKDKRLKVDRQKEYFQRSFNERDLSEALLKAKNPD